MNQYDVVIIGSGLGGLLCGDLLSREGYHVCVVEKNKQYGGCLQTFERNGSVFDTGMHYFGGMDKGKLLHRFFHYLGLNEKLNLQRLDEDGYDVIRYRDQEYAHAMGYRRFVEALAQQFPDQRKALIDYTAKAREISETVDPFDEGGERDIISQYMQYYSLSYHDFLDHTFTNPVLKNILAGTGPLYAGVKDRTPLYVPLMIHSTLLDGAYRFVDGGSQLGDLLVQDIRKQGGKVLTGAEVTRLLVKDSAIEAVELNHGERFTTRQIISDIHPKQLLKLVDKKAFTKAFVKRISGLDETSGVFSLYLSSRDNGFEYVNKNYYCYPTDDLWDAEDTVRDKWPKGYMVHFSPVSKSKTHTNSIIINTYMNWKELEPWYHTQTHKRGETYEAFKKEKAEKLLRLFAEDFPKLAGQVTSFYTSTPLTYRDYTGTCEGSAYGILKDYRNPFHTMLLPRTHIRNLLLTGQNVNTHGVVGVSIGAFLTCSELLGRQYLTKKIAHA